MLQKVYVIDDDPSIRHTLPRALNRRGYNVETFESGESYLSTHSTSNLGCLILDVSMPGLSGLDLQEALVAAGHRIPIIFITGHGGIPECVQALRAGAIDFLQKPFKPERLVECIEEAFALDTKLREEEKTRLQLRQRFESFTSREKQVFNALLAGTSETSSRTIAAELGISHRTVEQHRARLLEKTMTHSLPELLQLAKDAGISVEKTVTPLTF